MTETDSTPPQAPGRRSRFACLATPHSFKPDLGLFDALVAVLVCLLRIFGACSLFALWGGFCFWAWSAIGSRFWRFAVVGPLAFLFPLALAGLLVGIGAIEKRIEARG